MHNGDGGGVSGLEDGNIADPEGTIRLVEEEEITMLKSGLH